MEGEITGIDAFDVHASKPQIERRASPSESIFGNPYEDEKWKSNNSGLLQSTMMDREITGDIKAPIPPIPPIPTNQTATGLGVERSREWEPASYSSQTKSAGYIGEHKTGYSRSIKLKDVGETSEASDEPNRSNADPSVDSGISLKNVRWQHEVNESDSVVVRNWVPDNTRSSNRKALITPDETSGRINMVPIPASVMSPSVLRVTCEQSKLRPLFDERALEHKSNKVLQAFSSLALMHLICTLLFVSNTYFVPIYWLQDNDTGVQVGQITFQDIEMYCDECHESSVLTSESYLDICGIGLANEEFTNGFINDYRTAAYFNFIAFVMAAGNVVIMIVLYCLLLARRITDQFSQFIILFEGIVSLGELLVGLVVPLQTQLGTWNRNKVNDIFAVSEFECESTIYVYSSFGFLLVWLVLGCVLIDMALTQRLFTLVRLL